MDHWKKETDQEDLEFNMMNTLCVLGFCKVAWSYDINNKCYWRVVAPLSKVHWISKAQVIGSL